MRQKQVTGGRWRRIVLGHVLAEQVVVVEEVVRVSGRRGSGSLGSGRTAGCAIGEERTSPWLEADKESLEGGVSSHHKGWLFSLMAERGGKTAREKFVTPKGTHRYPASSAVFRASLFLKKHRSMLRAHRVSCGATQETHLFRVSSRCGRFATWPRRSLVLQPRHANQFVGRSAPSTCRVSSAALGPAFEPLLMELVSQPVWSR